jgi:neutral ceramidase
MISRLFTAALTFFLLAAPCFAAPFRIGTGISDITGPADGVGMMGYGEFSQKTGGIHTRLFARAFVVAEPSSEKRVAIVVTDLAMITQAIRLRVNHALQDKFGNRYTFENTLLTATHNHSGPGGYFDSKFYNFTIPGKSELNFKKIVNGIVESISIADQKLEPGRILISSGELTGLTENRSSEPYAANTHKEKYSASIDTQMDLLRFENAKGEALGELNWFPLHVTSINKHNHLISSDSKGLASILFEKEHPHFVAAFANSSAGDVTPIENDQTPKDEYDRAMEVGRAQYRKAKELFNGAKDWLGSGIDYQSVWLNLSTFEELCRPGIGYSMVVGATSRPSGLYGLKRGIRSEVKGKSVALRFPNDMSGFQRFYTRMFALTTRVYTGLWPSDADWFCQSPKPVLVTTASKSPSWTPVVLPFQVLRIGSWALVAVPGEITTMAGRRLRERLTEELSAVGVKKVIIAAYSNTYNGYLTTEEEYQFQHYEGASNFFGPKSLQAYTKIFGALGRLMAKGEKFPYAIAKAPQAEPSGEIELPDASQMLKVSLLEGPRESYGDGDVVAARFNYPTPNLGIDLSSFFEIQRDENGKWVAAFHDGDPETFFEWKPIRSVFGFRSPINGTATVRWRTAGEPKGQYRIVMKGPKGEEIVTTPFSIGIPLVANPK